MGRFDLAFEPTHQNNTTSRGKKQGIRFAAGRQLSTKTCCIDSLSGPKTLSPPVAGTAAINSCRKKIWRRRKPPWGVTLPGKPMQATARALPFRKLQRLISRKIKVVGRLPDLRRWNRRPTSAQTHNNGPGDFFVDKAVVRDPVLGLIASQPRATSPSCCAGGRKQAQQMIFSRVIPPGFKQSG